MKKFLKIFALVFGGTVLMGVASVALFVAMAYYCQPEAYGWSIGMAVAMFLSLVCFVTASDVYNAK